MPLLDRKEHPPGARVPPTNADEVFVIRCTGEVVLSYEEYTHKRNLYARHDWSDKYHGRGGLTYEEALRIEEQTESLLNEQVRSYKLCRASYGKDYATNGTAWLM